MNDNVDQIDDRTHIEQQIARTSKTEKSCIYVSIIPIVWWSRGVSLSTAIIVVGTQSLLLQSTSEIGMQMQSEA